MALSVVLFTALVALVALQRGAELLRSRRHLARLADAGHHPAPEPAYRAMVAVHAFALLAPPLEVALLGRAFVPALGLPALALLLLAQLGRVWVLRTLRGAWNVRVVPPRAIVTAGPYRLVRHPNYLIVCVELLALPLVHGAWLSAALATALNALVLRRRIALEEAVLAQNPAWTAAFAHTPRLVPRLRRAA
jgi:methyltransferase